MIYVAEYDHVKIKEQYGALQWKLWREHVQFAPPSLDTGQIGQVNDIDACIKTRLVLCETVELIGHSDVSITHFFQHIDIVGGILVAPFHTDDMIRHYFCSNHNQVVGNLSASACNYRPTIHNQMCL